MKERKRLIEDRGRHDRERPPKRPEERLISIPISQWKIPSHLLKDTAVRHMLQALFAPCPHVTDGMERWKGKLQQRTVGFAVPTSIIEEQRRTILERMGQLTRDMRIRLYSALGASSIGSPGLFVAEAALTKAREENFPPREWLLVQCAQHGVPLKLLEIVDVLLQDCVFQWESNGTLHVAFPPMFSRRSLREAHAKLLLSRDVLNKMSSLRAANLSIIAETMERMGKTHPDALSAEHEFVNRELDAFEPLRELPEEIRRNCHALVQEIMSRNTLEYRKNETLYIESTDHLFQRDADVLTERFRALPESQRLAVLEIAQHHELFALVSETIEHAYLRKRNPSPEHLRDALLVVLLCRGIPRECIPGIAILSHEWNIRWNANATKVGAAADVLTWTIPPGYTAPTLHAAARALHGIDPVFLEETGAAFSEPLAQQLLILAHGNADALLASLETPPLAEQTGRRELQHIVFQEERVTKRKSRRERETNGRKSADGEHESAPPTQLSAEAAAKKAREAQLIAMATEVQRYLYERRRGNEYRLKEVQQILGGIGIVLRRTDGKHSKEFFNPETGARHVVTNKQLRRKSIEASYIVNIVFGHHGNPGVGNEDAFYAWMLRQKDYRPRASNGARLREERLPPPPDSREEDKPEED